MVRHSVIAVFPMLAAAMGWAQPLPPSSRPVFFKRELVPADSQQRALLDSVLTNSVDNRFDPALKSRYNEVDAEKSLLIHDCALGGMPWWCLDPAFSFDAIFRRASEVAGVPPDQTFRRWMIEADATGGVPNFVPTLRQLWDGTNLSGAPFQLLAVTNRMDLGEWDPRSQEWRGAEIRFVYGLRGQAGHQIYNMNLILEFVLSGMPWRDYRITAGEWHQLRLATRANFTGALKRAVTRSLVPRVAFVRLRTNSNIAGGGVWKLAQWEFHDGGRFAPTDLDDQIRSGCVTDQQAPGCAGYLRFWQSFYGSAETPRFWPVPSFLLARTAQNDRPPEGTTPLEGMPMPGTSCLKDTSARRVISLQQCTSCHATETDILFAQIANREPDDPVAKLSAFLTGDVTGRPPFGSLGPKQGHVASVKFQASLRTSDGQCRSSYVVEQRSFNDLARRALFLSAVLIVPPEQLPDVVHQELMQRYQTDLTH